MSTDLWRAALQKQSRYFYSKSFAPLSSYNQEEVASTSSMSSGILIESTLFAIKRSKPKS